MFLLTTPAVFMACIASFVFCGVANCDDVLGALKNARENVVIDSDSCPAVNPKYPILLPHPDDCSKFYICDSGSRYVKECQLGLHFNPNIKACDYPERADCDKDFTKDEVTIPKGKIDDDTHLCPAENSELPVLMPHLADCNKFYICDKGSAHLKSCQQGLHFNPKVKACDYPKNAGCDIGEVKIPKGKVGDDTHLCPAEDSELPVLLPHSKDCNKFYICNRGSAHLKSCQQGLHFNPKIKACDYPTNSGCDVGEVKIPKGKVGVDAHLCPAEISEHPVLLPHPTDCNKFYICDRGSAQLKTCQQGLHFNSKINACDYPKNAACDLDERKIPKGKIGDDTHLCPTEDSELPVLLPHPADCNKFYICDKGSAHLKSCQQGLHYNPKVKACDYPTNSGCDVEMTYGAPGVYSPYCPSRNGKIPIFFRHTANCSVYYMCGNGLAYEFVCPARLHFNVRKRVCDYEKYAGCQTHSS